MSAVGSWGGGSVGGWMVGVRGQGIELQGDESADFLSLRDGEPVPVSGGLPPPWVGWLGVISVDSCAFWGLSVL